MPAYFGGDTLYARTWIEILEERADGYWPRFRLDEMVAAISDVAVRDYWSAWARVPCPTLVVGAEHGFFDSTVFQRMCAVNTNAQYVEIPDAGHDLHLDQPAAWRAAIEGFLAAVS
jgi:pimeloyl-ACP methyl ester carboxylesterase